MSRIRIIDKIKSYFCSDPPGVIFFLCVLAFILILGSFMLFISQEKVRNPDELDWNAFERKLADLDYCFKSPQSLENKNDEIFFIDKSVLENFLSLKY